MKERWKCVVGYGSRYMVSDQGRVWSVTRTEVSGDVRRTRKGKMLAMHPNTFGYLKVSLCKDGIMRTFSVHKLVLLAFRGTCPDGMERLHLNDVKTANRLVNLKYGTREENMSTVVRDYFVRRVIRSDGKEYGSLTEAGNDKTSNTSADGIGLCCQGKLKTSGKWGWEYL